MLNILESCLSVELTNHGEYAKKPISAIIKGTVNVRLFFNVLSNFWHTRTLIKRKGEDKKETIFGQTSPIVVNTSRVQMKALG